jgi:ATP adenylyltransferase
VKNNGFCSQKKHKGTGILWAPWRIEYIENAAKTEGCIFCEKPREKNDKKNLLIYRTEMAFVMMNRYPYNNGHLMIVPYRHTPALSDLTINEKLELCNLLEKSQLVLHEVMQPQGYNIGMNIGRLAGAGIVDHLHFHIVPRWGGDTNFMPILGHTKVISEALEETWAHLKTAFDAI